jgi:hypothetical protein
VLPLAIFSSPLQNDETQHSLPLYANGDENIVSLFIKFIFMARARSKNSLILKLKICAAVAVFFARLIKFGELLTRSLLRLSTLAANFHRTIFPSQCAWNAVRVYLTVKNQRKIYAHV